MAASTVLRRLVFESGERFPLSSGQTGMPSFDITVFILGSVRRAIRQYIHDYHHERIRLKLKGLSPVQYRTQPLAI